MFPVNKDFNPFHHYGGAEMDRHYLDSTSLINLSTSQKQEADITIMTAEGDRVTITGEIEFDAEYFTYSNIVKTQGSYSKTQAMGISLEESKDFSFMVEGELSEEEISDIKEALKSIDSIMKKVLNGEIEDSISILSNIGDLDTIYGLEASLIYEKTVSFSSQSTVGIQKNIPFNGIEKGSRPGLMDSVKIAADHMAKSFKDMDPEKIAKPIDHYFRHLFEGLSDKNSESAHKLNMAKAIKKRMLENLMHASANEDIDLNSGADEPSVGKVLEGETKDLNNGSEAEVMLN